MSLLDRVTRTIAEHDLIPAGSRLVIAVSGGSDSVALAYLLRDLAPKGGFVVAGLAHFNHQLRAGADADAEFCSRLATILGMPITIARGDVRRLARAGGQSLEEAARTARYDFLERAATTIGAERIAVGHTRHDQAETFLLKLVRGAGPRGLAGIYPRSGRIVRPLLDCSRAELREYLGARAVPFCEDETNLDLANPRNRIRHELIPYLQEHFSGGMVEVLAREAAIAREDADWLDREAGGAFGRIVASKSEEVELDVVALLGLHPAIGRRVAHRALSEVSRGRFVGFEHVAGLFRLAVMGGGARLDLPGQRAVRTADKIILRRQENARRSDTSEVSCLRVALSIPGEVAVPEIGWSISAVGQPMDASDRADLSSGGDEVIVEVPDLATPLAVRTRRAGDAFRPLGLGGRKKLQDFFVDRKVPRAERDRVPLVVDRNDHIVWVVGGAVDEDFKVTGRAEAVIILKAKRLAAIDGG